MKKKVIAVVVAVVMCLTLAACNRQIVDLTYSYDKAIVSLPNGEVVEGEISSWKDYDDGDQIQVVIDGTTYFVHSANIVLIKD